MSKKRGQTEVSTHVDVCAFQGRGVTDRFTRRIIR